MILVCNQNIQIQLVPPTVYVGGTLDPSNKGANITLSGGNLTASSAAPVWNSVRAQNSVNSGIHSFVTTVNAGTYIMVGFVKAAGSMSNYIGVDSNGWAWNSNNGSSSLHGTGNVSGTWTANWTAPGSKVKAELDLSAGTISFYLWNGSAWVKQNGTAAFTGLSGTFYAAISLYSGGAPNVTVDFTNY